MGRDHRRCTEDLLVYWPWADSAGIRRSQSFRSASSGISALFSAATRTPADWPMSSLPRRECRGRRRSLPEVSGRQAAAECPLRPSQRLEALDPLLASTRSARAYLGEIDGANVIKLHRRSGKVSYLVYPDFETDPHPALLRSVKLSLRTREIDCLEYAASTNPPVLHRKEAFLTRITPSTPGSPA